MSTDYDFYCVTCDAEAGFEDVRSPEALADLWAARARAFVAEEAGFVVRWNDWSLEKYNLPIDWMRKHNTHEVRVRDEYGRIVGTCGRTVICDHCPNRAGTCVKDPDHTGPCSISIVPKADETMGIRKLAASLVHQLRTCLAPLEDAVYRTVFAKDGECNPRQAISAQDFERSKIQIARLFKLADRCWGVAEGGRPAEDLLVDLDKDLP